MSVTPADSERRDYFRINQDVIFEFRLVDVHTATHQRPEEALGAAFSMDTVAQLHRLDQELLTAHKVIAGRDRLLADYLSKLSRKVDLLAHRCLFNDPQEHDVSRLNLSEGGMAFKTNRPLYKGAFLAARLIFLPSYTAVMAFAKVVRCDEAGDEYEIAAEFHHLRESDRQLLARENLRAQVRSRHPSSHAGETQT